MNSRNLSTVFFVIIGMLLAVYTGVAIMVNPTGGISGLSKLLTVICALFAFVSPRKGLYILAIQAIYTDQLKRIGVYYGAVSMQTVQEILIGPLITLCALNVGFFIQVMFGKVKLTKLSIALFAIAPLLGLYYLSGGGIGDTSLMKRLYNGGVAGLYTTVIPIVYVLFRDLKDWIRYLTFQTVLVVPSALWAIWQYFNGFSEMEWAYARSGLSPVHSSQMLLFEEPRVFGFFGSASALGCLCIYFSFSVWRTIRVPKLRWLFLAFSVIFFITLIVSTQRAILVMPLLFTVAIFCCRTKLRTAAFYAVIGVTFLVGVWQSTWLLNEGLDRINSAISSNTRWGNQVLRVSTFSDRLRGWERLKRPESWSLFGTDAELKSSAVDLGTRGGDFSHDMINRLLIRIGAVGLVVVGLVGGWLLLILHRAAWRLPPGEWRSAGTFALGITIPMVLASIAGGDNFTATPFNLAIWSVFAGVFLLMRMQQESTTSELGVASKIGQPSSQGDAPIGIPIQSKSGI